MLKFGLKEGRNADAAIAAESLIAWVDMVADAARALDKDAAVRVELLGRDEGSLKQLLRIVEDTAHTVSEGANEYPYLKKAAIGLAIAISTATLSVYVGQALEPDVQTVELSEPDRETFKEMNRLLAEDVATSKAAMRFYRSVDRDPAITSVEVSNSHQGSPTVIIPRSEFAMRSGMWSPAEEEALEEVRRETWDVVLLQAPFYSSPRHWAFARDGVRFSAQMQDAIFLQAITEGTLPISLHEGVAMTVEVEYRLRQSGPVLDYVPDSRKIVRVLSPRPAGLSASLAGADDPKK
nr:hypothetical protein [uncultured Sphingomonas sp.]